MEFKIREASLHDVEIIAGFNAEMAKETEGKELEFITIAEGIKGLMNKPQYGRYIIAETGGKPVGCLMITYEWTDWRNGLFWWIQSVYVKKEFRSKGIYRAMHEYIRTEATHAENVVGLRLYVEKENSAAMAVYNKMGMKETRYKLFEEEIKK